MELREVTFPQEVTVETFGNVKVSVTVADDTTAVNKAIVKNFIIEKGFCQQVYNDKIPFVIYMAAKCSTCDMCSKNQLTIKP